MYKWLGKDVESCMGMKSTLCKTRTTRSNFAAQQRPLGTEERGAKWHLQNAPARPGFKTKRLNCFRMSREASLLGYTTSLCGIFTKNDRRALGKAGASHCKSTFAFTRVLERATGRVAQGNRGCAANAVDPTVWLVSPRKRRASTGTESGSRRRGPRCPRRKEP